MSGALPGPLAGAEGPWGRWERGRPGVAVDGYFWRFTDRGRGQVALVLLGVNRDAAGGHWGTVGLATAPGRGQRDLVAARAEASTRGLDVRAWADDGRLLLRGTPDAVEVDLGDGARLQARVRDAVRWPEHAMWGGVGPAHAVPGLSQWWHPHLLTGRVEGEVELDGEVRTLRDAVAYGEKNWGGGGFPPAWWWGQAHGFEDPGTLVCFAGGRAGVGPLQATSTSLVVRLPSGDVGRFVRPLQPVAIDHGATSMRLRALSASWRVTVEVDAPAEPYHLPVPVPAERRNEHTAHQHLAASVRLVVRRGRRVVLRDESGLAGFERGTSGQWSMAHTRGVAAGVASGP